MCLQRVGLQFSFVPVKSRLAIISIAAGLFGCVSGYLGSAVDHYNHSRAGVSYSQWRGEWLGLPSLPGAILAELQSGGDWRADEQYQHRHSVAAWNALLWLSAAVICSSLLSLRSACEHEIKFAGSRDDNPGVDPY
jgi:hypothetical protein